MSRRSAGSCRSALLTATSTAQHRPVCLSHNTARHTSSTALHAGSCRLRCQLPESNPVLLNEPPAENPDVYDSFMAGSRRCLTPKTYGKPYLSRWADILILSECRDRDVQNSKICVQS